jgi:hypothetical protein
VSYEKKSNLSDSGYGSMLEPGDKDDDGDSVMTDITQASTGSTVEFFCTSEIEKLRRDINSLQDLEISMRRVLSNLCQLGAPESSPQLSRRSSRISEELPLNSLLPKLTSISSAKRFRKN